MSTDRASLPNVSNASACPVDPWAEQFDGLADLLYRSLEHLRPHIEHIGSTAICDLTDPELPQAALDVMLGLPAVPWSTSAHQRRRGVCSSAAPPEIDPANLEQAGAVLRRLGAHPLDDEPWLETTAPAVHIWTLGDSPARLNAARRSTIRVVSHGGPFWQDSLAIRSRLQTDAAAAKRFAVCRSHEWHRQGPAGHKAVFFAECLAESRAIGHHVTPRLDAAALWLRPLRPQDVDLTRRWSDDALLWVEQGCEPTGQTDAEHRAEHDARCQLIVGEHYWLLVDRPSRQPVGQLSLRSIGHQPSQVEIGIELPQREFRRRGLGRVALSLLDPFAQSQGWTELLAYIHRDNLPSQRFFAACGYRPVQTVNPLHLWTRQLPLPPANQRPTECQACGGQCDRLT